ncbi:MAG: alpha/beta hydrolase [Myxococcota bacterium]
MRSLLFALALAACNPVPVQPDASLSNDAGGGSDAGQDPGEIATTIRVHYPAGARSILLRGSGGPLNWNTGVAFTSGADDTWTYSTTEIVTETEWKPLLDDTTWSRGPNYRVRPGETVDAYPRFNTVKGWFEKRWPAFHSNTLNNDRDIWVYYPASYFENTRAHYPVVYMHDGQNVFDPTLAFSGNEWGVDEAFDDAAESGAFKEALVVAVTNTANRLWEYTPTRDSNVGAGGGADQYLTMLVSELKPRVDNELRTLAGRETTVLIGSSLGGLVSAYAGTKHPAVFGLIGELSPSTWWDNQVIIGLVTTANNRMPRPLRVYIDSGDSGPSSDDMANTAQLAQTYVTGGYQSGVDLLHVIQAGATHHETYWAQRFPGAMRFLLGPRTP